MTHRTRRIRGTSLPVEAAARRLRHNLTPAEQALWKVLRGRQLMGLKFRCQHPLGRFILDFYCPAHKLIIEVDGASHHARAEYDLVRTEQLQQAFDHSRVPKN